MQRSFSSFCLLLGLQRDCSPVWLRRQQRLPAASFIVVLLVMHFTVALTGHLAFWHFPREFRCCFCCALGQLGSSIADFVIQLADNSTSFSPALSCFFDDQCRCLICRCFGFGWPVFVMRAQVCCPAGNRALPGINLFHPVLCALEIWQLWRTHGQEVSICP